MPCCACGAKAAFHQEENETTKPLARWLTQQRGVRAEDIVLYGQSLGSGPTVDLASRRKDVAGVVLHAAFASCARPGLPLL